MTLPKIKLVKKPSYLKLAQDIDFFKLFIKLERVFDTCFILESLGEQSYTSRYSVIGFGPEKIIRAKGDKFYIDNKEFVVSNPYYALREIMPVDIISRAYSGGLMGYLSYESINYFEPTLKVKVHENFDQFMFGVYKDGLVLDKMTNEVFYFFYAVNRIDVVRKMLSTNIAERGVKVKFLGDNLEKEKHKLLVGKAKEEIKAGNTFQCQIGVKSKYKIIGDSINIYKQLRKINPSPYMYYVKFGDKKIIGASPELLFRIRQKEMETFPLAGTIRRGRNKREDKELARALLNDPKEIAEHNMLIDLHRNDLGKVAEFGTVKVRSLMDIKKFSHVQHISSEIAGILARDQDMFSGLASNFPAGTLSGAPKIESIKIIDRLEQEARGPYGGAVGYFGFNNDCTFAIPIRTLFISGEDAYTQTSGGIVYDSNSDDEYEEIKRKLEPMKRVLAHFSE